MPTTRRSAANARSRTSSTKGQGTISFSNRVTKSVPKDVKKTVDLSAVLQSDIPHRPGRVTKEEKTKTEAVNADAGKPETETQEKLDPEKITDVQINSYWRGIEKERGAPMIHAEGVDVPEKVLRYFDVSSQYGPCIGMSRMERWQRAEHLGLDPPIEVLATLLKEEKKGRQNVQTAHMDLLMNATALAI